MFVLQGQRVYNVNGSRNEKLGQVLIAYADHYKEVASVEAGNIVVVTGLKVCSSDHLFVCLCLP